MMIREVEIINKLFLAFALRTMSHCPFDSTSLLSLRAMLPAENRG